MGNEKELSAELEAPPDQDDEPYILELPRPLNIEEKKYLLAVERGDLANVRRMLQIANKPNKSKIIDVNCVDSLGRGALTLAIESENLEMVELLIIMGVQTRDSLLFAIDQEFVEAVELLLEHEELIKSQELSGTNPPKEITHSWQMVNSAAARYPPEMTPLILAAHRNSYEILKLLLDRGATLPMPHDVRCGCDDCLRSATGDPLKLSSARISEYKALASPSLIALSSPDPLMTAFQLSWELRQLAVSEPESRAEYLKLRRQVEKFAVDLLQQTRSTGELNTILNHNSEENTGQPPRHLARLEAAIQYKQKRFVAHSHVQQFLAAIWYEGIPGFRRMPAIQKTGILIKTALLFPWYCLVYYFAPNSKTGQLVRRPFMKFLVHASSYLFFLLILMLVSQRAEVQVVTLFGSEDMRRQLEEDLSKQRGAGPTPLEYVVILYVLGFIWQETKEAFGDGLKAYLRNMWNFIDFTRNSLYVATALLRVAAYLQQRAEIQNDPAASFIPRENWGDFDPQLIAEGLFAAANVFSALKLVHLFSINPHLGPLQISLGRMVIDIVKFFFIYTLVLFAFACGLNQLLWYFAELEKRKCYTGMHDPSWDPTSDSCLRWRSFSSLFESCQSLFWASFGGVGMDAFELTGIKSYTRFWGLLMFGSYSVINVIVLLNLLIAMMSNSYAVIEEHSDVEWKFARTKLWMSYFEESGTLPPPFNIFPAPKLLFRRCGMQKKQTGFRNSKRAKAREHKYSAVMRALVWRYVVNTHNENEMSMVTEDDIHEVKSDISSWRCELLDILRRNGMDIAGANTKDSMVLGKKMKVWERRLMKDFQVSGPLVEDGDDDSNNSDLPQSAEGEDNIDRWKRIARLAVLKSADRKWGQVIDSAIKSSQIGRSTSRASLKSQQSLKKAMDEAKKLRAKSPLPETAPIELPEDTTANILYVLKGTDEKDSSHSPSPSRFSPEVPVNNIEPKTMSTIVGYEDEKRKKNSQPLISIRTSPPKVIKRKAPPPSSTSDALNKSRSISPVKPHTENLSKTSRPTSPPKSVGDSLGKNKKSGSASKTSGSTLSVSPAVLSDSTNTNTNIIRPRPRSRQGQSHSPSPRRIPDVAITPDTPEAEARREATDGDRLRLVDVELKSPRFGTARKGMWL
ncbi:transient-receptor-potential-like protein [Chelonus insularis]|uniref:transient-receptor-potential-like protein n=1 Tax=Chelonus insularis TaxID=460826 RepID=UPI001589023C|nr:transient-receptor-potential-like protein [Chelonus insularis]